MENSQLLIVLLIVLLAVLLVVTAYKLLNKFAKRKKEKKGNKVFNPENLVEQNAFTNLNKTETEKLEDTVEEKENKFFN